MTTANLHRTREPRTQDTVGRDADFLEDAGARGSVGDFVVSGPAGLHDAGTPVPPNGGSRRAARGKAHDGRANPEDLRHVRHDRGTTTLRRVDPRGSPDARATVDLNPTVLGNADGNSKKKSTAGPRAVNPTVACLTNHRSMGCGM